MSRTWIDMLEDDDAEVRTAGRLGLIESGAVQDLLAVLANGKAVGRREAAQALGDMGAREAVPGLLAVLRDQPYEVAAWAARALGQIGDSQVVSVLIDRLDDEEMQNVCAQALAAIGDPAAIPPLEQRLAKLADRFDFGAYLGRYWLASSLLELGAPSPGALAALEAVIDRDFGPEQQQSWGSFRDHAVDLLIQALGASADPILRPFLARERETLQLRYRIARHYWLQGDQNLQLRGIISRMARHPLYPMLQAEARDLLATLN